MPTREFWLQIENHAWDVAPNNTDRLTGQSIEQITGSPPSSRVLTSPVTGVARNRPMFWPIGDALVIRRYTANWAAPDDHKVNPWDLNEPDPSDNGTMGTIPGPVIECSVGDVVVVHFRNRDTRPGKTVQQRAHSLHTHGFVFENKHDGAYPLSPPDPTQPTGAETPLWSLLGVAANKKGDRVPPPDSSVPGVPNGGTFTYTWNTFGWPTTAGVWLYHDHSICDMENVQLGAIGIVVIHNPADPDDVTVQDLPGGSPNGSPIVTRCFRIPFTIPTLPHDIDRFLKARPPWELTIPHDIANEREIHRKGAHENNRSSRGSKAPMEVAPAQEVELTEGLVKRGLLGLALAKDFLSVRQICLDFYRDPPQQALFLQLFHEMPDAGMLINGRKYLGNTPTLVSGPNTKMRFGVVGMNNMAFHTFHLHGHRWVIPGPKGDKPGGGNGAGAIQNSPSVQAVSQFEDTKIFGPANSFSFTIRQGTFMGAPIGAALGEWHMHCHVLAHMMTDTMGGMMGSLLVVQGGELDAGLPEGEPCPMAMPMPGGAAEAQMAATVRSMDTCHWRDDVTGTPETTIRVNGTVSWTDDSPGCPGHTVESDNTPPFDTLSPPLASGLLPNPPSVFTRQFASVGTFGYHCGIHGGSPASRTGMWGIVHVVP